jgi:tetratricopeptide (TPR) repeat protein
MPRPGVLALACLLGCAEMRLPPTFPQGAAGRPVVQEQAIVGLSQRGDAAVAQLIDAEGEEPRLELLLFDAGGGPSKPLLAAPRSAVQAVAQRLFLAGRKTSPVLAAAVSAEWPEAVARAAELGFPARAPAVPEPGRRRWLIAGTPKLGSLPLSLRVAQVDDPPGVALLLAERPGGTAGGDEVELASIPQSGVPVAPELWVQEGVVWMVCGSFLPSGPLHRAVGVQRGSIARGEARLHNGHGLADYGAGDLDAARREFDRAIAADPTFVDGLYNAAAAAALSDRTEDAVAFLRRAAQLDPARVQVLGRNDEDLKLLRKRPDVRALLGLRRLPPEDVPPPP